MMPTHTDQAIAEASRWLLEQQTLVRAPKREPLPIPIMSGGGGAPTLVIAAANSSQFSKDRADFTCTGADDEGIIGRAIGLMDELSGPRAGRLLLCEGVFHVNARAGDSAILFELNHGGVLQGLGRGATKIEVNTAGVNSNGIGLGTETTLRDLSIICNTATALPAISLGGDYITVDNVYIAGNAGAGIVGVGVTNVFICKCFIETGAAGIGLSSGCNNVQIRGNYINAFTSGDGVSISGGQGYVVDGNYIIAAADGIGAFNTPSDLILRGNYIDAGDDGIVIGSASWGVIEGNVIDLPADLGIWLQGGEWFTLAGNVINEPGQHGIRLDDQDDSTVYGNVVMHPGGDTSNTYDCIILHNESQRNLLFGNRLIARPGGNTTRYGLNVDDATCEDNVYYGNYASLASTFGTAAYRNAGTGTQNTMPAAGGAQGDNFLI